MPSASNVTWSLSSSAPTPLGRTVAACASSTPGSRPPRSGRPCSANSIRTTPSTAAADSAPRSACRDSRSSSVSSARPRFRRRNRPRARGRRIAPVAARNSGSVSSRARQLLGPLVRHERSPAAARPRPATRAPRWAGSSSPGGTSSRTRRSGSGPSRT